MRINMERCRDEWIDYLKTWDNPVLSGAGFSDFDVDGKMMVNFSTVPSSGPLTLTPTQD